MRGKRSYQSVPVRENRRALRPSRRAMRRWPSCLISCTQLAPLDQRLGVVGHRLAHSPRTHELGQPCDVRSDPPRLIPGQHLRLARCVRIAPEIDIRDRLAVAVAHDEGFVEFADGPRTLEFGGEGRPCPLL